MAESIDGGIPMPNALKHSTGRIFHMTPPRLRTSWHYTGLGRAYFVFLGLGATASAAVMLWAWTPLHHLIHW